jgi:hypothetical protein
MARSHKVAAAAQAAKDRQFTAYQQELGISLDDIGEESAPSTPQKAATWHQVAQSPQQQDRGAPGKRAAQVEPDRSSSVPIPTLPSHLLTLISNSLGPVGQDARSTKLLVSPGPSSSPYIKSPLCRSRSGDQTGQLVPGTPPPFTMLDSNFPEMGGACFESCNSGPPQIRTKMRAQHAAAALSGSRSSSRLKCVVESTLQYTKPNNPLSRLHKI